MAFLLFYDLLMDLCTFPFPSLCLYPRALSRSLSSKLWTASEFLAQYSDFRYRYITD